MRDWIYVNDHCDGIMNVLMKGKSGESYNMSANNEVDNLTIIKKILSLMDKSPNMIEFVEDRPGHDFRYSLDSLKIKRELGWTPKTNFEEGLNKTIEWYFSNRNWWKDISENALKSIPWKI